jgi:dihydrofolate reductase
VKTQYYTATTVDGFIADENHSLDWLFQLDASEVTSYADFIRDVGALAMGSHTYEWLLRHRESETEPSPWPYEQPTWVFTSRSLPPVPGANLRFVSGGVEEVHRQMVEAAAGRNVWVVGGGELVGQFHDAGLLDELILQVTPVLLGKGAPLLPRRIATPPLRLSSVERFGPFVELRYEVVRPGDPG